MHLVVFAVLVSLASDVNDIFGLFVFGLDGYMAIEAHHTARARRDGTPLPNPFGLNDLSERLGFGKTWPGSVPNPAQPDASGTLRCRRPGHGRKAHGRRQRHLLSSSSRWKPDVLRSGRLFPSSC